MKKFPVKAVAAAMTAVCGSAAFATANSGQITAPAATTKYAVESLISTTDITAPAVVYFVGVARTTAQDFTVLIRPTNGAKFDIASCTTAAPVWAAVGGGTGGATVSLKRASEDECAYEVDVTTAFSAPTFDANGVGTVGSSLTLTGLKYTSHKLATAGETAGIEMALFDLGETARIDTTANQTVDTAKSGQALRITAAADTGTKADVNDEMGPLFGFVTAGADVDATADASFIIHNNALEGASYWKKPDGSTAWNFGTDGTTLKLTIAGNYGGMAANGIALTGFTGTNPTAVTTAANTSVVFTALPANFTGGPGNTTVTATFTSARTTSLGTSRVFGVQGLADVVTGADEAVAGSDSWWTWGANAIQLSSPWFSTDPGAGVFTRFFFQNLGTDATYSAECQVESAAALNQLNNVSDSTAVTVATPAARVVKGTLFKGLTVLQAKDVCTFSSGTRGSVTFTINAPAGNVKGLFKYDLNGTATTTVPLERTYAAGTF